ncbi:MAG: hypothetical protein JJE27_04290, partial [Thermoleophilia bacterium]|nr:hypothetical protein [Thermoleophilia bacterium]
LAGACALIIALAGVALISPRGDRAAAARSTAPLGVADGESGGATSNYGLVTRGSAAVPHGAARDPFAAKNFKPRPPATAKAAGKRATGNRAAGKNARGREPKSATPATARPSLFVADFITYSSYTPWIKIKRRSGGWIDFGGKPTVKVVSVGDKTVELFVVTDVEVLADRSRAIDYSDPIRIVKLKPKAIVRFADYRDVQGEDVEYTIRFRGSLPIDLTLPG